MVVVRADRLALFRKPRLAPVLVDTAFSDALFELRRMPVTSVILAPDRHDEGLEFVRTR
jgi:hypothetical protein